jgi:hypothetical protein
MGWVAICNAGSESSWFFECGRIGHKFWLGWEETPKFPLYNCSTHCLDGRTRTAGSVRLVWSGCASGSQLYTEPKQQLAGLEISWRLAAIAAMHRSMELCECDVVDSCTLAIHARESTNTPIRPAVLCARSTQEPGFDSRNTTGISMLFCGVYMFALQTFHFLQSSGI